MKYIRIKPLIILILAAFCGHGAASGQATGRFEPGYYRAPLDMRLLLSANFAEARTNHLHAGIDVKTAGVEGKPLHSAADGYIARVNIAPWGYGRALYIAHPNGTTTVYAHMQKFTPEVEAYVAEQRYAQKRHSGDFYTESNPSNPKFRVARGEFIGNAGNSGSSSGPHLHFEIRETPSQRILNVVKQGVFDIKDDLAPMIVRLHYIEVDTLQGVPVNSPSRAIDVVNVSRGVYKLAAGDVLELGRCGYFVLEATDRKNDTQNTMGIYSARLNIDERTFFAFHLDGFTFDQGRYVNSLTHYAMQRGSRNEFLRLAVQAGNRLPVYSSVRERGAVYLDDDAEHNVVIEAEDDNGNISRLSFRVKRRANGSGFKAEAPAGAIVVSNRNAFSHSADGLSVSIPAGALYEPVFYTQSSSVPAQPKMKLYSPVYRVFDAQVPLHVAMTVSIDAAGVPEELRSKLCMVSISAEGKYSHTPADYKDGKVVASVRNFGSYAVVADTKAPTISPSFADGADLRAKNAITFTLRDDFSGVKSFSATIDGRWIPFEQQGAVITHNFDASRFDYNGGKHTLSITATDSKGNSTTLKRTFIR